MTMRRQKFSHFV